MTGGRHKRQKSRNNRTKTMRRNARLGDSCEGRVRALKRRMVHSARSPYVHAAEGNVRRRRGEDWAQYRALLLRPGGS